MRNTQKFVVHATCNDTEGKIIISREEINYGLKLLMEIINPIVYLFID